MSDEPRKPEKRKTPRRIAALLARIAMLETRLAILEARPAFPYTPLPYPINPPAAPAPSYPVPLPGPQWGPGVVPVTPTWTPNTNPPHWPTVTCEADR